MISLCLIGLGWADELDLERARAALASEDWMRARDLSSSVVEEGLEGIQAHLIYLESAEESGWLGLAAPAYVDGGDPLRVATYDLHQISIGEDRAVRGLDQISVSLAREISARASLWSDDPAGALVALGQAAEPTATALRLTALRDADRYKELLALAKDVAAEHPNRPDLLAPIGPIEPGRIGRLVRRIRASVRSELQAADPLYLYRARLFAIAARDFDLSREIGKQLEQRGEPLPLYRPPRAPGTRRATATILARRGRAQILPGPPSEMEDFVRHLSDLFLEEGNPHLSLELWSRFRQVEDTAEYALRHGQLLLEQGESEAALATALDALSLAARPDRNDPGGLAFAEQRARLAGAWGLRSEAEHALGNRREAIRCARVAQLLDPSPRWTALHARTNVTLPGTNSEPLPATHRPLLRTAIVQAETMLAAGEGQTSHATALEAARLGSGLASDGQPLLTREELARVYDLLAATESEPLALAHATTALWLDPGDDRFLVRARLLEARGDLDAAFVAYAIGGGDPSAAERTWMGLGPFEPAAIAAATAFAVRADAAVSHMDFSSSARRRGERPRVGEAMPAWQVQSASGTLSGERLAGRVVVLSFWASWCGPCQVELPALERLARELEAENAPVSIVAISVDANQSAYRKAESRLRLDRVHTAWMPELQRRFRIRSLPQSFLVGADGIVVRSHSGFTPGDEDELEREIRELLP